MKNAKKIILHSLIGMICLFEVGCGSNRFELYWKNKPLNQRIGGKRERDSDECDSDDSESDEYDSDEYDSDDYDSDEYESDLIKACRNGNLTEVERLIESGVNLDEKNFHGETALISVFLSKVKEIPYSISLKIVKKLISSGADVNLQDNQGTTALMYANFFSENSTIIIDIMSELIAAGADLNLKTFECFKENVLEMSDYELVNINSFLINAGADICTENENESNKIYGECDKLGYITELEWLTKIKKLDFAVDKYGMTILHRAVMYNSYDTLVMILNHIISEFKPLFSVKSNLLIIEDLINKKDNFGFTAFDYALIFNQTKMVRMMKNKFSIFKFKTDCIGKDENEKSSIIAFSQDVENEKNTQFYYLGVILYDVMNMCLSDNEMSDEYIGLVSNNMLDLIKKEGIMEKNTLPVFLKKKLERMIAAQ